MHQIEAWTMIPFAIMLLVIAVAPLAMERIWEKNLTKLIFTLAISVPTAIYMIYIGFGEKLVDQIFFDYLPFIVLLGSLFVVTGGIRVSGDVEATPVVNTLLLATGFLIASFMGTTGAAMLMIRPLLSINSQRAHKTHTVMFFIALVANCGGVLTPLGDPPLFLLYLRGAPFGWFMHLVTEWLFVGVVLLTLYALLDWYYIRKESAEMRHRDRTEIEPIRITGCINFLYLAGIIASVACINESYIPAMGGEDAPLYLRFLREIVLVCIILMSLWTTKKSVREGNRFSWDPIAEVAILFVGIFITMTPALMYLNAHAADLGLSKPWQFFYATGLLSSFLDNAPTAVAFHTVAGGLDLSAAGVAMVAGIEETLLRAIALGAVFFGAMTYIGNGPNFMVKAIAEQEGVRMPSFFGYMFKFSLVVLLPVYIVMQLIFL